MKSILKYEIAGFIFFVGMNCLAVSSDCSSRKLPKFSHFKISKSFHGPNKPLILRTKADHLYRTNIREAAKHGPNFAAHYVVAEWGCGSGCHDFVVIDLSTGNIFDPPFRDVNFHMPPSGVFQGDPGWNCLPGAVLEFHKNSALLIVEGCLDYHQCGRTYYKISKTGLKQIAYDPDLLPNGKIAPI